VFHEIILQGGLSVDKQYLYQKLTSLKEAGMLKELPNFLNTGLSTNIQLREYQEEAFKYFVTYFENDGLRKNKQVHTLFHMATGSGKTVIMAGIILYLYTKGYRNFLFFVNQTNVLEKTKENFTNQKSSKYLFNDVVEYLGNRVNIKQVDNFSDGALEEDIQICFTTTQKLHMDLFEAKENSITYADFEDNKVVFISDESHHINTMTKKQTKEEEEAEKSWEYSVSNAFSKNKDSIMLEFTATADLKDTNVQNKYVDKIIYDYPLAKFRESGYTKDFQNFATDTELWDRALIALVISEYRKYLFADLKLNIKPVIMMKSQKIKESEEFFVEFFKRIKNLTTDELLALEGTGIPVLKTAIQYFATKDNTLEMLRFSLMGSFTEDTAIIMNGSSDNSKEKQLLVNSLEDQDNPIRVIFAVDMLNEGWDVLNLFDIVRLYDTRQASGKAGKIGAYTIKEAQLIGRGARYCPFGIDEEQSPSKRKYDFDLDNPNRILETMYFHSRNDSRYITELKAALIATGLQAENPIEIQYSLKEEFKESDLYRKGYVFSNKRLPKGRNNITTIEPSLKNKTYKYTQRSSKGVIIDLFGDKTIDQVKNNIKSLKFSEIDYHILRAASESYNELRFDVVKSKYPSVKSMKEFLTSDKFLGNSSIEITYGSESIGGRDIFKACVRALEGISNHIVSLKQEFEGSQTFEPMSLREVIRDKKIYLSKIDPNGGIGDSQTNCINDDYRLNLSNESWYAFNDNYGTSEEKLFIKHFKSSIEPKLQKKDLEYYVIRNERVSDLAIYSFEAGERFEPDFLLFVRKKNIDSDAHSQVYIEPKGGHLLLQDSWKEDFLLEIEGNYRINSLIKDVNDYQIIGLPFFNNTERKSEFEVAVDHFLEMI
jgi:type III restriction enzyme